MSDDLREAIRETMHEAADTAAEVTSDVQATDATPAGDDGGVPDVAASGESGVLDATSAGNTAAGSSEDKGSARQDTGATRARDATGKFSKAAKSATTAPTPQGQPSVTPQPKTGALPAATPAPAPGETSVALKAPQSWKPAARESWGKLPPAVQQEVDRREKEMQAGLREAAEKSKRGDALSQVIAPFENHIRRKGGDPAQAVQSMLQFRHTLETGTEKERATAIAQAFQFAGVSEDALVEAITGQRGQGGQGQSGPVDPRSIAAQVRQELMQEFQQQGQQRQFSKATQELSTWSQDKEFFEDVRPAMEGLIRAGVARGYQDAYDRACWANPEVRGILQQREAATAATSQVEATQRARAASSSVKSQPASVANGSGGGNLRDDIRQSIAESRRR